MSLRVVYGVNSAYILPALVSICSLHRNASRPVDVTLWLEPPIKPHDLDMINRTRDHLDLCLTHRMFTEDLYPGFRGWSKANSDWPLITLLPLALPQLVEERCLFIDADTLVVGDVCELLDTDLRGMPLGACLSLSHAGLLTRVAGIRASDLFRPNRARIRRIESIKRMIRLGFIPKEDYFNSGVLLMDCDQIRNQFPEWESLSGMESLRPFADQLVDQDVLNLIFRGRWHRLPLKWNTPARIRRSTRTNRRLYKHISEDIRQEVREASERPMVWHYLGRKKPWIRQYRKFPWTLLRAYRDYARTLNTFESLTTSTFDR